MIEYTVRVYADGQKEWWVEGKRHRVDGPAIGILPSDLGDAVCLIQ